MEIGVRLKAFLLLAACAALIAGGGVKHEQQSAPRGRSLRSGGVNWFDAHRVVRAGEVIRIEAAKAHGAGNSDPSTENVNLPMMPARAHAIGATKFDYGQTTAPGKSASQWELTWNDEFDGPDGSAPDPAKWTYDIGVGSNGWGNNELEYYTNRPQNVAIRNGKLVITALEEKFTGPNGVQRHYTSARIKTKGLFSQAYGRFEARIKIPSGQGMWPAFWMLGANIDRVRWPNCGEIDIMENIGKEPRTVHGTIHGPGYSHEHGIGARFSLASGSLADDYHVYAVEWEPEVIRFYLDDRAYATRTPADLPRGAAWVFDQPFFILLNVAVGGDWPGPPDATTVFPQTMLVDYVRVYRRKGS